MKLHRVLVEAVVAGLEKIFSDGKYADDVVENTISSNKKWGARDRSFIAENIYDIVRNYRLYSYCANSSKWWNVLGARFLLQQIQLPDWDNLSQLDSNLILERFKLAQQDFKVLYSIPDWLEEDGVNQLGSDAWHKEMQAMHTPAQVCLRVNTIKTTVVNAHKQMELDGFDSVLQDECLILKERKNIRRSIAYQSGWVEIQDANSQKVAKLLNPQPGEMVVDACAGAGGKTLHLASLMKNKGTIYALDVYEVKLNELLKRTQRAGVKIVKAALMESAAQNFLFEKADKLLLDVPCSGLGVLRRNPDAKWKLSSSALREHEALQWSILSSYHTMLKKGGEMLYTTCSIMPSENQLQVQRFINEFKGKFELEKEYFLSPAETGFDGFYMALFRKK